MANLKNHKTVGINSLFLVSGKVGGTEVFFREQIKELSKIRTNNKYIIYANLENKNTFGKLPKNFSIFNTNVKASNRISRILYEQFILPFMLIKHKVNLLHSPGYTTPLLTHCKKITTIFDLNYHFHPEDFGFLEKFVYSILIPLGAHTSDLIIVHSNKAKSEMHKVLKVSKKKIHVIHGGVPDDFKKVIPLKKSMAVVNKYNIKPPYILANATIHLHKNLISLIKAFVILSKKNNFKHKLVLIGIHGTAYKEIDKLILKSGLKDKVVFTNTWIDHSKMKYFNRLADIFVIPSLYEGFGLPTVEAMACGVPIIASKYSCTPEVVGNGGLIVDVKKPIVIATAVESLLRSKSKRDRLSKLGKLRARSFSWKDLGRKIYNLYNV